MTKSMHSMSFQAVRPGIVSSIDRAKGTARVHFEDDDDRVSPDLKIVTHQTMKTKYYWMPDVGETVICAMKSNGDGQEMGYILGSVYSEVDTIPEEITDQYRNGVWYEDGTVIKYELDTKTVVIDSVGKVNVKAKKPITIIAESDVFLEGTLHVTKDVIANGVSLVNHVHTCPDGTTSKPVKG